eukprot:gene6204-9222_t
MVAAVVVGATGLVGSLLLLRLLNDERYARVIAPTRRQLQLPDNASTAKLVNPISDNVTNSLPNDEKIDHVYICIGTTRKKTPNPDEYKAIDVGIPDAVAQWAADMGASYLGVVSSAGADTSSMFRYSQLKGEMEELVLAKDVPNISILQPSIIYGKRNESRVGESIAKGVMSFFGPLLPKNVRGIQADAIAERLLFDAFANSGKRRVPSGDIPLSRNEKSDSSTKTQRDEM